MVIQGRGRFATRQYAYVPTGRGVAAAAPIPLPALQPRSTYQFILGRDAAPRLLSEAEVEGFKDPFARLILKPKADAGTLRALLDVLDASASPDVAETRSFVVADGGQIPWTATTANLDRLVRFLVARGPSGALPVLFVSTSAPFDSSDIFLQVIGWDPSAGAYRFYDRRGGAWIFAGSSWDALSDDARGNGPFDSHINGGLNMKELELPWQNWHSMSAAIQTDIFPPGDPLPNEPLWVNKLGAERLEQDIIRPGLARWTDARAARRTEGGRLTKVPEMLRQVLTTTTINLAASPVESSRLSGMSRKLPLPIGFFVNADVLFDRLGIDPGISDTPTVPADIYLQCLVHYDVSLSDGAGFKQPGDTHFAFVVPKPAFEDTIVFDKLRELGVLSDQLAAAISMIDFSNPVFSERRAALLQYVPETASVGTTSDFELAFVGAVKTAASHASADSVERELLSNLEQSSAPTWRATFGDRIGRFFGEVAARLTTFKEFAPYFELAESRRREFRTSRATRQLAEFRLTTPLTNIPEDAPLLRLNEDGTVGRKDES